MRPRRWRREHAPSRILSLRVFAALAVFAASARHAPPMFLCGKTVQVLIGFSAGGGYDIYARTLARHIGRHIPGNPTLVPQNMPGAGTLKSPTTSTMSRPRTAPCSAFSRRASRWSSCSGAPRANNSTPPNSPGSAASPTSSASAPSGLRRASSLGTICRRNLEVGGSGGTSDLDIYANVLRNMFHLPGRLITGFPGGTEVLLAMQRGEVDGRCGWSWTALLSRDKRLLDKKLVTVPLQLALDKNDDPSDDVPLIIDLTNDPKEKARSS